MTNTLCGTCIRLTQPVRGTYGLCGPFTRVGDAMPWWATGIPVQEQTYVRPDEGAGCPAWSAANE